MSTATLTLESSDPAEFREVGLESGETLRGKERVHEEHVHEVMSMDSGGVPAHRLVRKRMRRLIKDQNPRSVCHRLGRKCRKSLATDAAVTRTKVPQVTVCNNPAHSWESTG